MKPAPFEYRAPSELGETLELLQQHGEDAKLLAGGQSLMPLMNLRLARPKVIIDINRLSKLSSISAGSDGGLVIGALARQRAIERSATVKERSPLLAAAMPLIGHFQIRNRGTIGGSLAHADPAAELPAVSLALGAEFVVRSTQGERIIGAKDFFVGYMATAIEPNELLTEIRFPSTHPKIGWAIEEVTRRRGDFAMVGVATLVELNGKNTCHNVRIVLFGVGEKPERMERAECLLRGKRPEERELAEVARSVSEDLDPVSDVHASAEYRKEVGGVITRRALAIAFLRAQKATT